MNIQSTEQYVYYLRDHCLVCSLRNSDLTLNQLLKHQLITVEMMYKLILDISNILKEYSYLNITHGGINGSNICYNNSNDKFYLRNCGEYLLTSKIEITQSYDVILLGKLCKQIYGIINGKDAKLQIIIDKMIKNKISTSELINEFQRYSDKETSRYIVNNLEFFLMNQSLIVKSEYLDEIVYYYGNDIFSLSNSKYGSYQLHIIQIDYPYYRNDNIITNKRSITCRGINNNIYILLK